MSFDETVEDLDNSNENMEEKSVEFRPIIAEKRESFINKEQREPSEGVNLSYSEMDRNDKSPNQVSQIIASQNNNFNATKLIVKVSPNVTMQDNLPRPPPSQ